MPSLTLLKLTVKERWPNYQKCHFTSNCEWQFPRSQPPTAATATATGSVLPSFLPSFLLILVHFANPNYTSEIFPLCHCERDLRYLRSEERTVLLPELCALFTWKAINSRQMGPKSISNPDVSFQVDFNFKPDIKLEQSDAHNAQRRTN